MSETYIQIPPDSTGKRIRHPALIDIVVTSEVSKPRANVTITGATSGATGTLTGAYRASGVITYHLKDVTGTFVGTENLQVSGVTVATVSSVTANTYMPAFIIADPNTPEHRQVIDFRGAANVRFAEGEPQVDGFGRIQMSQMQAVGEYYHIGGDRPEVFWTKTTGSGSVTYDVNSSMMVYSTGTASGAESTRTTQQYHPYKPGTSQLMYFSNAIGDIGKANVIREWGYYDDYNGFGFRLNGTQLQVFLRSDVTGSVVEEVVNQADWSNVTLANNDSFEENLDVSKGNIYWADMEWLGVGRVRLGIITTDGRRVTCHEFRNANKKTLTYMRTGSLPLRWLQKNTGTAASTSEMRVSCGVVFTEVADIQYGGRLIHRSPPAPITFTDTANYVPFLSFRPQLTVNGKPNRIIGIHEDFDWYSEGDALHIAIFKNPATLTGASWAAYTGSMLEMDTSATAMSQESLPIESFIAGPNQSQRIHLGDRVEKSFGLNADGVTQDVYVFAAKVLKTGGTGKLFYSKFWKEIR